MSEFEVTVGIPCAGCGEPLRTANTRGLCPACLVATTTPREPDHEPSDTSDTDSRLDFGTLVGANDRFLLLDRLGEGGMGEVWLAKDQELSRPGADHLVALKFISPAIRHDPRALAALRAEVLSSQALSHPHIVRIFDLHLTLHGTPFIKMEYVEGNSLRHWLKAAPDHVMPWRMACHLALQLASALVYAHDTVRIAHRDLKPANLLMAPGFMVKLSDFGISQTFASQAGFGEELVGLGTIAYASPQQLAGNPPDPSDDMYSFGATLYELLTGSLPFRADTPEEMIRLIQEQEPDPVPHRLAALRRTNHVPARLLVVIQRCLNKDPQARPRAQEVLRLLPQVEERPAGAAAHLPTRQDFEPAPPPPPPHWAWRLARGLLFATALGLLAWGWKADYLGAKTWIVGQLASLQKDLAGTPPAPRTTNQYETITSGLVQTGAVSPAQLTTQAPAPATDSSALQIMIRSAAGKSDTPYQVTIRNYSGVVSNFWTVPNRASLSRLRSGLYQVTAAEGTNWVLQKTVQLQADRTEAIEFGFLFGKLKITSEPTGVLVHWPEDVLGGTEQRTPFERSFPTGIKRFTVSLPHYLDFETNFTFTDPRVQTNVHLVLQRNVVPRQGENWTNSLQQIFLWIPALNVWASDTETRVQDFREFVKATGHEATANVFSTTRDGLQPVGRHWLEPGPAFTKMDDYPVVGVNWADATAFGEWLTARESELAGAGLRYALPTTNQWFGLAGTNRFPWGDSPTNNLGNYSGTEAVGPDWPPAWPVLEFHHDQFPRTAPVRSLNTNSLGLYHLGGNAAEWCAEKVLCGGSWSDGECRTNNYSEMQPLETRSVRRVDPNLRSDRNGFRLLLLPAPKS